MSKENSDQPLVSIVVPVYNGGEYFKICLDGIAKQTYRNWECVVNNNCSEDDTLSIANDFARSDSRFKVYTNDTFLGMIDNWNLGCSRINPSTKYLKVVGADDWLFPENVEKMVEVMEKYPTTGICSSYRLCDRTLDMYGLNIWDGNFYKGKEILHRQLTRTLDISGSNSTVTFRLDVLKKIPRYPRIFDSTSIHEDTELEYEVMNISDVGFVFQVLSYTRRHAGADTSKTVWRYNTLLQLNERILWQYKENDKTLNKLYRTTRLDYAWFLFYKAVTFDWASIRWHNKWIVRKFTISEYILGILLRNKVSRFAGRILGKLIRG